MGRTGRKKKQRTHAPGEETKVPQSFILHTGNVGHSVEDLMRDMRKVMEPFTASKLRMRKQNVLKDFVNVAGPLGVTHFMIFNQTDAGTNLRVARIPRGPTITFRVSEYSLRSDVIALQRRPPSISTELLHPALLILNNFPKESFHLKLIATMFQNMFPSIDIQKVNLNDTRRCALFHYDAEKNAIEFRHYMISAQPVGVSRTVKRIIQARIPNLANVDDIADYVQGGGAMSDSEAELDNEDAQVVLPQRIHGVGNTKSQQSAIKLTELGPRMLLSLIKIEQGFCEGDVLHHEFVTKTPEEIEATRKTLEKRKQDKERRKRQQEENVKRKQAEKDAHKQACLAGMATGEDGDGDESDGSGSDGEEDDYSDGGASGNEASSEDDDAAYYREEVGEEPDPELFSRTGRKGGVGVRGVGGKRWAGKKRGPDSKGKGKGQGKEARHQGVKRGASGGDAGAHRAKKAKPNAGGSGKRQKPGAKGGSGKKPKISGFVRKRTGGKK